MPIVPVSAALGSCASTIAKCSGRTPRSTGASIAPGFALTPTRAVRPPGSASVAAPPSTEATPTEKKFMLGEPMKAATNLLAGWL